MLLSLFSVHKNSQLFSSIFQVTIFMISFTISVKSELLSPFPSIVKLPVEFYKIYKDLINVVALKSENSNLCLNKLKYCFQIHNIKKVTY